MLEALLWAALLGGPYESRTALTQVACRSLAHSSPLLEMAHAIGNAEAASRAADIREAALDRAADALGPFPQADMAWYRPSPGDFVKDPLDVMFDTVYGPELLAKGEGWLYESYPFPRLRRATREWARDKLDGGVDPKVVGLYLDRLRARDARYYDLAGTECPYDYCPPAARR